MPVHTRLFSALILGFLWTGIAYAQEQGCQLVLTSEPTGAEVSIQTPSGEELVGETPFILSDCTPGVYQLSLSLEGYETWTTSLSREPGQAYLLPTVVLEKKPEPVSSPKSDAAPIRLSVTPTNPFEDKNMVPLPLRKYSKTAGNLSLGLTLASHGVLWTGFLLSNSERPEISNFGVALSLAGFAGAAVAPSAGHFYAGDWSHGLLTSALRLGTPLATILLSKGHPVLGLGLGMVGLMGLTFYDLVDSRLVVYRQEKKLSFSEKKASFSLVPAPITSPDGATHPGLFAVGRF